MSTVEISKETKDLAILANDAYTDEKNFYKIKSWDILHSQNQDIIKFKDNNITGFRAKAYKNNDTGEITIAYAGTATPMKGPLSETAKDFFFSDLLLGLGVKPFQLDAVSFFKTIREENPNSKITLTGHSLGGMLAILVGNVI